MKNLNTLVTQGDNFYFLSELGGVAVAREPGRREGMGLSLVRQRNTLDGEEWGAGNNSHP